MKAIRSFFMAMMIAAFVTFALGAQAQKSTSFTNTNGQASSGAGINSGNNQTGGYANGGSNGLYNAAGKEFSAGSANSKTKTKSTFSLTPNSASSLSAGKTKSSAFALGAPKNTNTTINGGVGQGTWAQKQTDSMNGVSAGNNTGGQYQANGKGTSELNGNTHAIGGTKVIANEGPTDASTSLKTFGSSRATTSGFQDPGVEDCHERSSKPQSSVQVSGNGGGNGQSYLANGNNYSDATNGATMNYSATGKNNAAGMMGAFGNTRSSLTPTTATSSSDMTSFSAAHGH